MKTKYVIEKMDKKSRVWWTGDGWSDVDTDAWWFESRKGAEICAAAVGGSVTGFEVGA